VHERPVLVDRRTRRIVDILDSRRGRHPLANAKKKTPAGTLAEVFDRTLGGGRWVRCSAG